MRTISIRDLNQVTVTRARGQEAAPLLVDRARDDSVEIMLDDAEIVSGSFLDELIRRTDEAHLLRRVTFVTARESTIRRLKAIAANRTIVVYWRQPSDAVRRAASKERSPVSVTYVDVSDDLSA
jgi:hypothetical protein